MDPKNSQIAELLFEQDVEAKTGGKVINIQREHAVDSYKKFDATLSLRLWLRAGAQIIGVVIKSEKVYESNPFCVKLTYAREDASQAINATAVGVTIHIASEILCDASAPQVSIIFSSKERLLIKSRPEEVKFGELVDGVAFDISRMRSNFEAFTFSPQGRKLVAFLSGAWQLYLRKEQENFSVLKSGPATTKPKTSIVTVFYKNTGLAAIYPLLTGLMGLGRNFEVVMCFQESQIFKGQIEWIRFVAEKLDISLRIVLIQENIGFSAANNLGVKHSSGDVVMLLNPDIICNDISVYAKISAAASSNRAVIGSTLISTSGDVMHNGIGFENELSFENKKPFNIARTYHISRHISKASIKNGALNPAVATTGALIAVTRKLWDELGGLSEKYVFAHFEDVDFCKRAEMIGVPCLIHQNTNLIHIESYSSGENGMSTLIKLVNSNIFNQMMGA